MRYATSVLTVALVALAAGSASAQRLASYDAFSAGFELAGRRCPPLPPSPFVRPLPHPAAAGVLWNQGAIASANQTQRLYWANGPAAHGIQRMPFSMIGMAGAAPSTFPIPPAFNEVTGMVVSPNDPQGRNLWVTDGSSLCLYRAPGFGVAAAVLGGPWAWPGMAGATQLTGLTFNPFSNLVVAVDDASNRYTFDPATFAWSASLPPAFAPPPQATGTQICLASARTFVTYHNGDVRDIATGMLLPFPPNPGGVRQHQGLTYMGTPVWIGGGGNGGGFDPVGCPWAGNLGFGFQVNLQGSSGGRVFVVIDVGGQGAPITLGSSTAFVNPSTSTILDLGNQAQSFFVPLPIPEAALGSTAVIQAAILRPDGSLEMLDAWQGQVFKLN